VVPRSEEETCAIAGVTASAVPAASAWAKRRNFMIKIKKYFIYFLFSLF
jgi:hypothetical protein